MSGKHKVMMDHAEMGPPGRTHAVNLKTVNSQDYEGMDRNGLQDKNSLSNHTYRVTGDSGSGSGGNRKETISSNLAEMDDADFPF